MKLMFEVLVYLGSVYLGTLCLYYGWCRYVLKMTDKDIELSLERFNYD
jgi:hypothetical protein